MSDYAPRKFLTHQVVVDWLQWAEFPEDIKAWDVDMPQMALSLIAEYKKEYATLLKDYEVACAERDTLRAKLERLESGG